MVTTTLPSPTANPVPKNWERGLRLAINEPTATTPSFIFASVVGNDDDSAWDCVGIIKQHSSKHRELIVCLFANLRSVIMAIF
ncbi:hypothetical protein CRENPOLYSF2_2720006 [Crenothrix polyspora]|uniref:Uncharacterized protein n=1 Tax=Crenothrix polyspora TaxID=360316 RepID=A0A1R4H8H4_9GAMM|nr:hypothetical protein CRENPOLYSF2_2720006 [Crenothrix polyspora]